MENNNTDHLSPYELFQLETYGNILNNADPYEEFNSEDDCFGRLPFMEEAYVFKNENPE